MLVPATPQKNPLSSYLVTPDHRVLDIGSGDYFLYLASDDHDEGARSALKGIFDRIRRQHPIPAGHYLVHFDVPARYVETAGAEGLDILGSAMALYLDAHGWPTVLRDYAYGFNCCIRAELDLLADWVERWLKSSPGAPAIRVKFDPNGMLGLSAGEGVPELQVMLLGHNDYSELASKTLRAEVVCISLDDAGVSRLAEGLARGLSHPLQTSTQQARADALRATLRAMFASGEGDSCVFV